MREYDSPGMSYEETEEHVARSAVYNPIIGIVGGATKGPRSLIEIKNSKKLKATYGSPVETDFAVYGADYIIEEKCVILFQRVMGKDASQGQAGTPGTDRFIFKTRDYDSSLEGARISLKYNKEKETVDYQLVYANGTEVENYKNLPLDPTANRYLPRFLDTMNSPLVAHEDFPEEEEKPETSDPGTSGSGEGTEPPEPTENAEGEVEVFSARASVVDDRMKDVVLTMRGVDDGIKSLAPEDYIKASGAFTNLDSVNVDMLIVPGVTDSTVQAAYEAVARDRGDCEFIPDIPFGTNPKTALEFVNSVDGDTSYKFDEQQVSVYGPWVKINDITRKKSVWTPPSIIVARVTAQSDRISKGCWFAVAGFGGGSDSNGGYDGRGIVPRAIECEYALTKEDRDLWQGGSNVLNPIVYFIGKGTVLFGNKTTKRTEEYAEESFFCSRNIRRMANYVRRVVLDESLKELFNPNDPLTWASWKTRINPYMKRIKDGRGIEAYKIVMDETTVTEEDIRNHQAPAIIYVKPIGALEFIKIKFAVTDNNVIFQDEEEGDEE